MDTLVEKTSPGIARQRRTVKRVKDAHDFLNKQYDNTWKIHTEGWKPGIYAYAGGQWHNVKSLDPTVLAHI
jgi:hypothetical protein